MKKFLKFCIHLFIIGSILGCLGVCFIIIKYSQNLPSIEQLQNYSPDLTSRLYSADGVLLKEYATEKRLFVKSSDIPDRLKQAFISAEDSNFYEHVGIDLKAILSAAFYNIKAMINKSSMRGASTITQQVAKNFLLTNERSLERKIKEAILSVRITEAVSKEKVLELYLNQIFLGYRAYGVAAAALNYFNKSLDELTIEECALLASLPKAPGKLNPKINYQDALDRRNWVLRRMYEESYINKTQMTEAQNTKIEIKERPENEYFVAGAFTEDVRKVLVHLYSEEKLMKEGLVITTTLEPKIQKVMQEKFADGLENYDRRMGYRGALANIYKNNEKEFENNWFEKLKEVKINSYFRNGWKRAVILSFNEEEKKIYLGLTYNNEEKNSFSEYIEYKDEIFVKSFLTFENTKWAKKTCGLQLAGNPELLMEDCLKIASNMKELNLHVGDIILVKEDKNNYVLKQVPSANGAGIMFNVHTGRILGMVGGYVDAETTFNRATQANRQLGSIMKPLVYLAAFENNYTPASMIMDEEIILNQGRNLPPYIPTNYIKDRFYGLVSLRTALQNSHNVASVRLASEMGLDKVTEIVRRFNISKRPPALYSLVLGSVESKLINITKSYGMFVNGGKEINTALIEKIQDKYGMTIYKRDKRECNHCIINYDYQNDINNIIIPELIDNRKQITDPAHAYQITSILEGVVKSGTAWRAKTIENTIGGKTGTSNDFKDAWFIGFSPDIVMGIFIGFDDNRSLGDQETGARAALPIFVDIMKEVLKDTPAIPFRIPANVELTQIDKTTGEKPTLISDKKNIIFEAFKKEKPIVEEIVIQPIEPQQNENIINNSEEIIDLNALLEQAEKKSNEEIPVQNNQKYLKSFEEKQLEEQEANETNDIDMLLNDLNTEENNNIQNDFYQNENNIEYLIDNKEE